MSKTYLILTTALIAGCTNLPVAGPAHRDITAGATASLTVDRDQIAYDYVLVDINKDVLSAVSTGVSLGSFYRSYGAVAGPAPSITVGTGDVLQLTIFESSAGGSSYRPKPVCVRAIS